MSDQNTPEKDARKPRCSCCGKHTDSGLLVLDDGRGFFIEDGHEPIEIGPEHWLYPYLPKLARMRPPTVH
jgi:hypothetical protein